MASRVPVNLSPTAGFCIKSSTLQPALLKLAPAVRPGPNSLEPQTTSISVPKGQKIFINFAWDSNVPPPPEGNEEAIQRAMRGEDDTDHPNPDAWFVPVVVSDAKQDTDKAGKPSLVFDCIYHTSIRSRSVRDPAFKIFIQELGLQRIEAQTALVLSRQVSTPNIASKGKLLPRTVLIPSTFLPTVTSPKKSLIEELDRENPDVSVPPKGKGILKATSATSPTPNGPPTAETPSVHTRPTWRWAKTPTGSLEITIAIPSLTHTLVSRTTLDLEARRVLLAVPSHPPLDINLGVSDAEIAATSGGSAAADAALMLKRERALDVAHAAAEWRVAEGVLVLVA